MLDEGEDIVVLDTRNDYETRVGMFDNAVELDIPSFRDFPDAIETLPDEYRSKTVVMYCTGGIRCEKASAVMLKAGFEDVRQLEGGILGTSTSAEARTGAATASCSTRGSLSTIN